MYMLTSASILTSVNSGFSHVMMSHLLLLRILYRTIIPLSSRKWPEKESSAGAVLFSCFTIDRGLTFLQGAMKIFSARILSAAKHPNSRPREEILRFAQNDRTGCLWLFG